MCSEDWIVGKEKERDGMRQMGFVVVVVVLVVVVLFRESLDRSS